MTRTLGAVLLTTPALVASACGGGGDNAKTLYTGRAFESLRQTIRTQLLSGKRNAAWAKWLEQVEREYASKIEHGEGFEPTG